MAEAWLAEPGESKPDLYPAVRKLVDEILTLRRYRADVPAPTFGGAEM